MTLKGFIYTYDFAEDDGNWTFSNASITDGVLNITVAGGYGDRSPDADWHSDSTDDFELEVDAKQDASGNANWQVFIYLVDDANPIKFGYRGTTILKTRISWDEIIREETAQSIDDTNWHTMKIRRVGTVYYLQIDSGTEISWDYGTARAINYIKFGHYAETGDYDNLVWRWIKAVLTGAISFSGTINKKMFKTTEGSVSFVGTLTKKMFKTCEGAISFIGTLTSKKLWSKLTRAVASFTKTSRDTASWEKEERN